MLQFQVHPNTWKARWNTHHWAPPLESLMSHIWDGVHTFTFLTSSQVTLRLSVRGRTLRTTTQTAGQPYVSTQSPAPRPMAPDRLQLSTGPGSKGPACSPAQIASPVVKEGSGHMPRPRSPGGEGQVWVYFSKQESLISTACK